MRLPDTKWSNRHPEPVYPKTVKIDGLFYASVWTDGKRYDPPRRVLHGPFERRSEARQHYLDVTERQAFHNECADLRSEIRRLERLGVVSPEMALRIIEGRHVASE